MFSVDSKGRKIDAHIHEPILNNQDAEDVINQQYLRRLMARGYPEDMIQRVAREIASQQISRKPKTDNGSSNGGSSEAKMLARGGPGSAPWNVRKGSHITHTGGMIKSSIPGRTDKIPLNVKSGSYILPSETVSALGQNNTMAGGEILTKMFKQGPYGTKPINTKGGKPNFPRLPGTRKSFPKIPKVPMAPKPKFADGGETDNIPIIAAGGEWVVPPEVVTKVGGGDMNAGHKALDAFVLKVRKKHIETLKSLKPPKR